MTGKRVLLDPKNQEASQDLHKESGSIKAKYTMLTLSLNQISTLPNIALNSRVQMIPKRIILRWSQRDNQYNSQSLKTLSHGDSCLKWNWEQCLTVADQSDRYEGTLHQLLEKSGPTNGATNQHFPRWPSGLLLLSLTAYLQSHCRAHQWGKCRIQSLSGGSVWTEGRSRCSRLWGRGGEPRGCGTEELSPGPRQCGLGVECDF